MRVLILGGTGTLGQELVRQLYDNHDLAVLSRDEQKQVAMARVYPDVRYGLGDITDKQSLKKGIRWADLVFHVAALKHVDFLEGNPVSCMKVNVLGTQNVVDCCNDAGVRLVFSSTDKAVDPINAYGYSKALAEKIVSAECENYQIFRWGNVLGSRGSVIPVFKKCILDNTPVPITDLRMTRFWLTINSAVGFMIEKAFAGACDEYIYPEMKAARVLRVVESIARVLGHKAFQTYVMGIRPGEKLHESLISAHKKNHINSETCVQYTDDELDLLLKPILDKL